MGFAILLALSLAAGQPAAAVERPSPELVERFLAALPDAGRLDRVERSADPAELERLTRLNPGREDDIRPVLEAHAACASPFQNAIARAALRRAAERLERADLERMLQFYHSEDLGRLDALGARLGAGETLGAADQAELDRIVAAYPVMAFAEAMQREMSAVVVAHAGPMEAISRCDGEKQAALQGLGVDTEGPPLPMPVPPN